MSLDAELPTTKRRTRRLLLWLMAAVVLAAGIGIFAVCVPYRREQALKQIVMYELQGEVATINLSPEWIERVFDHRWVRQYLPVRYVLLGKQLGRRVTTARFSKSQTYPWLRFHVGSGTREEPEYEYADRVRIGASVSRFWPLGRRPPDPSNVSRFIETVAGFENLQELIITDCEISESTFATLAEIELLENLDLTGCRVTPEGLAHLAKLPRLKALCLKWTNVTDAGLEHLGALPSLEHLSLVETDISDRGLAHLVHIPTLRSLDLENVPIGEGFVESARKMPALKDLVVSWPLISRTMSKQKREELRDRVPQIVTRM